MIIKTKVTFKEYVKLLFKLTYKRTIMKILLGVAFLILLWIIFYYTGLFNLPEPIIYQYIALTLILVVQPIVVYITIYNVYYSSNQISEPLEMEIYPKEIKIHGDSFYMEVEWEKLFKIVERRNWFLFYQNKLSAIIVPKKDLNPKEIDNLRENFIKLEKVQVDVLD